MKRFRLPLLLLWTVAVVAPGCQTEDPAVAAAREAHASAIAADDGYAEYALGLAARTDADFARAFVVDSLGATKYATSNAATKAVADDPVPAAQDAVRRVFEEKGGLQKYYAAVALGRLGDAEALDYVVAQVEAGAAEPSPTVAGMLSAAGRADALRPMLETMIGNDDAAVRDRAYAALSEIDAPWATQLLVRGLKKEFGEGREMAIRALGRTGDPAVATEIAPFVNTRGLVEASLTALGRLGNPATVGAVQEMHDHDQVLVRAFSGPALIRLGETETGLATVQSVLDGDNVLAHERLAEQLGGIDAAVVGDALRTLAQHEDAKVRRYAWLSLIESGALDAELLRQGVADRSDEVNMLALEQLANRGGAEDVATIKPLLEDRNPYVVVAAANAILAIDERRAGAAG